MEDKKHRTAVEAMIHRAVPSQVPVHVVKRSYDRMLVHCTIQTDGRTPAVWACQKNGARVKARMTYRNVFNRTTMQLESVKIPVATLYCSGCDPVPSTHGNDPIFSDELQTLAL